MARIEFVIQEVSGRGTGTPCVARTVIQAQSVVGGYPLSTEDREQILEVSFAVMRRLAACEDILERVGAQVAAGMGQIERSGLRTQAGGRATDLPSVLDLQDEVELFLYTAKLALRDIARLFRPLYGKKFDHKYHKIRTWAEETYGALDPLVVTLAQDAPWIEQIINMRNVVEHPDDPHGPLTVKNFTLISREAPFQVLQPVWYLRDREPAYIASDMRVMADNLLTFYEDLLVVGLRRKFPMAPFDIMEIPEQERDPACPVRLRLFVTVPLPEQPGTWVTLSTGNMVYTLSPE